MSNLNFTDFLNKVDKVDKLIEGNAHLKSLDGLDHLKENYLFKSKDYFAKEQADLEKADRLLKIAILGRVNAGKSSFLNALLFGGESILPKAATPMTAALTILEYGEKPNATVDFYSESDIAEIKANAAKFEQKLKEKTEERLAKMREKRPNATEAEAKNLTIVELKQSESKLSACADQYERILKNPINLSKSAELSGNINEIKQKLKDDYVGESGKFMPYTQSITLRLNNEALKDIQIVDTPGLNDPVPSRSARTTDYIDQCDCALILSPAGQFMDQGDVDLLKTLANKAATARICFIASKSDGELHMEYKDESNGDILKAAECLKRDLAPQLKRQLDSLKSTEFSLKSSEIVITSTICASIAHKLKTGESIDDTENHALSYLKESYPDDFSEANLARSLEALANMQRLNEIFAELKDEKEKIIAQRLNDTLKVKCKNLADFIKELQEIVQKKKKGLNATSIEEVKKKADNLKAAKAKGLSALNNAFEDISDGLVQNLRENLRNKNDGFFSKLESDSQSARGTKTETYEIDHGLFSLKNLFGNRYETKSTTVEIVNASSVVNSIRNVCSDLEDLLNIESKDIIKAWRRNGISTMISKLRAAVGDENVDADSFERCVRDVFSAINLPEITYSSIIPDSIKAKRGELRSYEAQEFINDVTEFIGDFKSRVKQDINSFAADIQSSLLSVNLGDKIFTKIENSLKQTEQELKDKEKSLAEYDMLEKALKECE